MADDKKKGFDLGKSDDSAPGFDLNKESAAPVEQSKGFDLGKGEEPAPSKFDLGKGQEAAAAAPKKAETKAKGSAQAKEKSKQAEASKSKAPAKEKAASEAKSTEKGKAAGKEKAAAAKTAEKAAATAKSQPKASKKRSNTPVLVAIIVLIAVGLFMFMPFGGESDSELAPTLESQSNATDDTQAGDLPNVGTTEDLEDSEGTVASEGSSMDQSEAGTENTDVEKVMSGSSSQSDNSTPANADTDLAVEESTSSEAQSSSVTGEASSGGTASSMSESVESSEIAGSDDAVSEESSSTGSTTSSSSSSPSTMTSSEAAGVITFSQNSTQAQIPAGLITQIKSYLSEGSANGVLIEGHSSSEGDNFYNIGLSRRRAESVKSQLVKAGIDATKIEVQAKGSDTPVASNQTVSGRKKNRRAEVKLK